MEIFLVGGAVRDHLLGISAKDRDYCVVGSSVEEMLSLGFRSVGKDFPVFLHPVSSEEYALARIERKVGPGYSGFSVNSSKTVTLQEDLSRRDLTINAMAMDAQGQLTDPFSGTSDLRNGILRHVSDAFAEDPVRILRIARFSARHPTFVIAEETKALMRQMVQAGEVDHLVPERVWQELSKGLMEEKPSRMIEVLRECGALARIAPELDRLHGVQQRADYHPEVDTLVHVLMALDLAASGGSSLSVRFATLVHDLGKGVTPASILPSHHGHEKAGVALVSQFCERLKVPSDCRELAVMVCEYHTRVHQASVLKASSVASLLKNLDAFRRPERFHSFLSACEFDARGRLGFDDAVYPQKKHLIQALVSANSVDVAAIVSRVKDKRNLPQQIHVARTAAIKAGFAVEAEDSQDEDVCKNRQRE
jgi:tRNA nucleotidyltransferase (CCA-adding enzyme)